MTSDADTSAEKEKVFHGCVLPVFFARGAFECPLLYCPWTENRHRRALSSWNELRHCARLFFRNIIRKRWRRGKVGFPGKRRWGARRSCFRLSVPKQCWFHGSGCVRIDEGKLANGKFSPRLPLTRVGGGILKPPQQDEGHIATMDVHNMCRCYFRN